MAAKVSKVSKIRKIEVPDGARALDPMEDPAYAYACELSTAGAGDRSAEQWARALFEGAPLLLRGFLVVAWRAGLGLRLGPRRSPDRVLGWEILSSGPEAMVIGVGSFALTSHLVVLVDGDRVVHSTLLRYERGVGRVLWAVARPIHEMVVPYLLRRAARSFDAGEHATSVK